MLLPLRHFAIGDLTYSYKVPSGPGNNGKSENSDSGFIWETLLNEGQLIIIPHFYPIPPDFIGAPDMIRTCDPWITTLN
jgi:hypothetical protein